MSCLICAETTNGTSHKGIKCEFCEFEACLTCCKTYILDQPFAKCMGECNKEWTRQFLTRTFGQTFVTKPLKKHREQVLFERERALLPSTQPVVENLVKVNRLKQRIKEIDEERRRLAQEKAEVWQEIHALGDREPQRSVFTKACPDTNCRGFLSTQWKCGLCEKRACPECHEQKDEDHVCNPDQVATAKLLANDTKPCPKCQTPIYKIDGCDQMWCPQCHTAFSWKTGRTETIIHNPHYYEWMRKQSPTGEIPRDCGNAQMNFNIVMRIRRFGGDKESLDYIASVVRHILHIQQVEVVRLETNHVTANQDLRVSYMLGKIDEEKFKILLQRAEKSISKREEMRGILLMLVATVTDIVRKLENDLERGPMSDIFPSFLLELETIREYTNEQLMEVSRTYKSASMQFGEAFRILQKDAPAAPRRGPIEG